MLCNRGVLDEGTETTMKIGELARLAGSNAETIRYYERVGMVSPPNRTESGYRTYTHADVDRLRFISRGRELGFSIEEIRALLAIADGAGGCADVYALTTQHLDVVRRKIADLRKLQRILSDTAARCARDASPDCPIIEALAAPQQG